MSSGTALKRLWQATLDSSFELQPAVSGTAKVAVLFYTNGAQLTSDDGLHITWGSIDATENVS